MSNIIKFDDDKNIHTDAVALWEFDATFMKASSKTKKESALFKRDKFNVKDETGFFKGNEFSLEAQTETKDKESRLEEDIYLEEIIEKAENIQKEAYLRGLELGLKAGHEEAKSEFSDIVKALNSALSEVVRVKKEIYSDSKNEILDLVMLIAKKVIHSEVSLVKDKIVDLLKWVVHNLTEKDEIRIKINPDDMEAAIKFKEDFKKIEDGIKGITFEEDSSITKGGCFMETRMGTIDARIGSQLDEIEKILRKTAK